MNWYNGFSPTQRTKALKWFRQQQKDGLKPHNPTVCDLCFQDEGIIDWHSEDYSEPFGSHIGEHGVCYICHMMLHCRFKSKQAWDVYVKALSEKKCFTAFKNRNWIQFKQQCLNEKFKHTGHKTVEKNGFEFISTLRLTNN